MNERIAEIMEKAKLIQPHICQYVYVIGGDGGTTKIGIAKTPARRLRDIKTNSGRFDLRVVKAWRCGSWCRYVERQAHMLMDGHKAGGEWFNISPEHACSTVEDIVSSLTIIHETEDSTSAITLLNPSGWVRNKRQGYGKRKRRGMQKACSTS